MAGERIPAEVDVVVVGLGPGGEEVAGRLADAGLAVLGIEAHLVGGECPYYGCVPSKMMIRAADLLAEARRIGGVAGAATVAADFGPVARRIRDEATDDWDDAVAVERFTKRGGHFVRGRGVLEGHDRVRVDDRLFTARRAVVLNTGTSPAVPPIEGLSDVDYWTNREAVKATEAPASLVVLGGGAIGLELAQAFARFGTRVSVVEAVDRLLPVEEPEAGEVVRAALERDGVDVHVSRKAGGVSAAGGQLAVALDDGSTARGDRLLVAVGRRPNTTGIGLETVGVEDGARVVPVDDRMRVTDGVYAIGDIVGHGAFTHMSMYQASIVVADVLGRDAPAADYRGLAWVTFTDPEVGRVGKSEQQAREAGIAVATGTAQVASSARGWIHGPGNDGFVKLVADTDRRVLVGATSVGPRGGDVLAMLTLAVHAEIPLDTLRTMIYAYPTFHRAVQDALRDLDA